MLKQQMLKQQKTNTLNAYDKNNLSYDMLDYITSLCTNKHTSLHHTFSLPLTEEIILQHNSDCNHLINLYSEYSFSFISRTVTERATGKCQPLKKFLKSQERFNEEQIIKFLDKLDNIKTDTLVITNDPWFLIGSSVTTAGKQIDSSCHYPGSDHKQYKSGPISYALDTHTAVFVLWSDNGIQGRQLVHISPDHNYIVTGRLYGDFTEAMSTACRTELYKLLSTTGLKKAKNHTPAFHKNGFQGYLDTGHYITYRDTPNTEYTFDLCAPLCPSCGEEHTNDSLYCEDCNDDNTNRCEVCGDRVYEDDLYYVDNVGCLCEHCFHEDYFYCDKCGEVKDRDNMATVHSGRYTETWCEYCAEKKYYKCSECGEYFDCLNETVDGDMYCDDCLPLHFVACENCGLYEDLKYMTETIEGTFYCSSCDNTEQCDCCGQHTSSGLTETVWSTKLCDNCIDKHCPDNCPVCGKAQDTYHTCSHTCATENLFMGGKNLYA